MKTPQLHRGHAGVGRVSGVLIVDSFTDSNGTALGSHLTDTGESWDVTSGAWQIQSNQAVGVSGVPLAVVESGISDGTIEADVYLPMDQPIGIVFRYVDNNNYFLAYCNPSSGTPVSWRIYRTLAGGDTLMHDSGVNPVLNSTVTQKIELAGTNIKFYVDGSLLANISDGSFLTATKHGLRLNTGAPSGAAHADNFRIES